MVFTYHFIRNSFYLVLLGCQFMKLFCDIPIFVLFGDKLYSLLFIVAYSLMNGSKKQSYISEYIWMVGFGSGWNNMDMDSNCK